MKCALRDPAFAVPRVPLACSARYSGFVLKYLSF
jgi:hypothetical protein